MNLRQRRKSLKRDRVKNTFLSNCRNKYFTRRHVIGLMNLGGVPLSMMPPRMQEWADAEMIKYRKKSEREKRQFEEGRGHLWRDIREFDALVEKHGGDLDAARQSTGTGTGCSRTGRGAPPQVSDPGAARRRGATCRVPAPFGTRDVISRESRRSGHHL